LPKVSLSSCLPILSPRKVWRSQMVISLSHHFKSLKVVHDLVQHYRIIV
jgi:hypothetical protein